MTIDNFYLFCINFDANFFYIKNDIGFYRNDGLGICCGISKSMIERKIKLIVKTFKQCGITITIECNLKTANFLDITFDLQNKVYKPYRKANDNHTHIGKNLNHPPSILKQFKCPIIQILLQKRLSEVSLTKDIFDKSLKLHQDALKDSGFSNDLHYVENKNNASNSKRKWKRKIIWFNHPFSKKVKINIGKIFLQFLSKYFPKNHKIHKI